MDSMGTIQDCLIAICTWHMSNMTIIQQLLGVPKKSETHLLHCKKGTPESWWPHQVASGQVASGAFTSGILMSGTLMSGTLMSGNLTSGKFLETWVSRVTVNLEAAFITITSHRWSWKILEQCDHGMVSPKWKGYHTWIILKLKPQKCNGNLVKIGKHWPTLSILYIPACCSLIHFDSASSDKFSEDRSFN